MDDQCDKLVTVVGHQFITLTVHICVQHGGLGAPRRAGLLAAAETCLSFFGDHFPGGAAPDFGGRMVVTSTNKHDPHQQILDLFCIYLSHSGIAPK